MERSARLPTLLTELQLRWRRRAASGEGGEVGERKRDWFRTGLGRISWYDDVSLKVKDDPHASIEQRPHFDHK